MSEIPATNRPVAPQPAQEPQPGQAAQRNAGQHAGQHAGTPGMGKGGTGGLGQNLSRHGQSGSTQTDARAARFAALLEAGADAPKQVGTQSPRREKDRDEAEPDQLPAYVLASVTPEQPAPTAKPLDPGSRTAAQVETLTQRITTEIRAAESMNLMRGPNGVIAIKFDLGRTALGITGVEISFGPKELIVTMSIPSGAAAHNVPEAMAALAQALAMRHPDRPVRILRKDEIDDKSDKPDDDGFDPLNPVGRRR